MTSTRKIYAIYDRTSMDIIGPLQIHRHDTAAIRMFGDVASMENSGIARHPDDYALLCLGELHDATDTDAVLIVALVRARTVMEGSTWAAAVRQQEEQLTLTGERNS